MVVFVSPVGATLLRVAAVAWLAAGVSMTTFGCGASLHSVYEGDVRFEHCMALDAQPTVKSSIRRACWTEWVTHYTYGQTKDRVRHAQLRIQQLSGVSTAIDPGEQPLSAAPPPDAVSPDERCAGDCRAVREDCSRECATAPCHKSCSVGFQSCVRECGG